MIKIELKNIEDFKRLAEGHEKTIFFKRTQELITYYVISEYAGTGMISIFKSERPLKFNDGFNPEEPESISVGFLVEIEDISPFVEEKSS